jgi:hypothetical protein
MQDDFMEKEGLLCLPDQKTWNITAYRTLKGMVVNCPVPALRSSQHMN